MLHYLTDHLPFESEFRGQNAIEWIHAHGEIPVFAVSLYLGFIFYVPKILKKPLNGFRTPFAFWNLFLSFFSIIGMTRTVPVLLGNLDNHGFYYTVCENPANWYADGAVGLWVTVFILSKIPELLDTVFLVIQKKEVIFLHWFHHVTVLLYCWHAFHHTVAPGLWFATMNYSVHSIMYFYYFMAISGYKTPARKIAPLITTLQLLQMVGGSAVTVSAAYWANSGTPCHVEPSNYKLGLAMYLSYFVLFAVLFYDNYLAPQAKHSRPNTKAASGKSAPADKQSSDRQSLCGVEMPRTEGAGLFHPASNSSVVINQKKD